MISHMHKCRDEEMVSLVWKTFLICVSVRSYQQVQTFISHFELKALVYMCRIFPFLIKFWQQNIVALEKLGQICIFNVRNCATHSPCEAVIVGDVRIQDDLTTQY